MALAGDDLAPPFRSRERKQSRSCPACQIVSRRPRSIAGRPRCRGRERIAPWLVPSSAHLGARSQHVRKRTIRDQSSETDQHAVSTVESWKCGGSPAGGSAAEYLIYGVYMPMYSSTRRECRVSGSRESGTRGERAGCPGPMPIPLQVPQERRAKRLEAVTSVQLCTPIRTENESKTSNRSAVSLARESRVRGRARARDRLGRDFRKFLSEIWARAQLRAGSGQPSAWWRPG